MREGSTLGEFQSDFARALFAAPDSDAPLRFHEIAAQPGFAVYRNTVMKGCIDALQANYPSVHAIVGEEWFRAAAAIYVRGHPPRTPTLLEYGEDFEAFIIGFEPAAALPYLAPVARLDRYWTEAHIARDEAPLAPGVLAGLHAEALASCRLSPHASARWAYFGGVPAATIWRCNRDGGAHALTDIEWRGEGLLLVRAHAAVEAIDLDAAGCAFMSACAEGGTLADAAARSLALDAAADFSALMARLLGAGAFGSFAHERTSKTPFPPGEGLGVREDPREKGWG
jgi:hypothetical protein